MSGEIEVDESYFLLRLTARNCVVEGAKRVRCKRGRGAGRKSFYFVTPSCPFARRYAKKLGLTLYARGKTLLGKRVASYYKGFYRSRKCHNFRKVSKSKMTWLIFASFCLATLQEGAKAHYMVMQMSLQRGETTLTKL
ncbi:hypothetical protein [Campylobacter troglodytis]|uniref:hypothetical protein n=1 Tax=Campylobacter troglodytis TaxID=654363 RepID=UPI0011596BBA|nr:hypothetical protein [Campylobacter troglodytis]TQR53300.1 hypothetical protein DMC01_11415 [Campylobacter troglodytis]